MRVNYILAVPESDVTRSFRLKVFCTLMDLLMLLLRFDTKTWVMDLESFETIERYCVSDPENCPWCGAEL